MDVYFPIRFHGTNLLKGLFIEQLSTSAAKKNKSVQGWRAASVQKKKSQLLRDVFLFTNRAECGPWFLQLNEAVDSRFSVKETAGLRPSRGAAWTNLSISKLWCCRLWWTKPKFYSIYMGKNTSHKSPYCNNYWEYLLQQPHLKSG